MTCPVHHIPLVTFCPACRGQKGGQAKSEPKATAARANVAKARAAVKRSVRGMEGQ